MVLGQITGHGKRLAHRAIGGLVCGMSSIVLRTARPQDADALTACFTAAYAAYREKIPDLPPVDQGIAEDIAAHSVWVAEIAGTLVGGAVLVLEDDRATLANIATHPDYGGRGVARALIGRIEEETRRAGATTLNLATHVAMPDNVAFYEGLGWRESGRDGNKILMTKPL